MKVTFHKTEDNQNLLRISDSPEWERNMVVDIIRGLNRGTASPVRSAVPLVNDHSECETRVLYAFHCATEETEEAFVNAVSAIVALINA